MFSQEPCANDARKKMSSLSPLTNRGIKLGIAGLAIAVVTFVWFGRTKGVSRPLRIFAYGSAEDGRRWVKALAAGEDSRSIDRATSVDEADIVIGAPTDLARHAARDDLLVVGESDDLNATVRWQNKPIAVTLSSTPPLAFLGRDELAGRAPFASLDDLLRSVASREGALLAMPTDDGHIFTTLLFAAGSLSLVRTDDSAPRFDSLTFAEDKARAAITALHSAAFSAAAVPQECSAECARNLWKEGRAAALIGRAEFVGEGGARAFIVTVPAEEVVAGLLSHSHPDERSRALRLLHKHAHPVAAGTILPSLDAAERYAAFEEGVARSLSALLHGRATPQDALDAIKGLPFLTQL